MWALRGENWAWNGWWPFRKRASSYKPYDLVQALQARQRLRGDNSTYFLGLMCRLNELICAKRLSSSEGCTGGAIVCWVPAACQRSSVVPHVGDLREFFQESLLWLLLASGLTEKVRHSQQPNILNQEEMELILMRWNLSFSSSCPNQAARWAVAALAVVLEDISTESPGSWDGRIRACAGDGEAVITGQGRTVVRSWDYFNLVLGSVSY